MMGQNLTFLIGPDVSAPFFKSADSVLSQPEVYGFMKAVFGADVVYDAEPKMRKEQMLHMAQVSGLVGEYTATTLPRHCYDTSTTLLRHCHDTSTTLLRHCYDTATTLPRLPITSHGSQLSPLQV